jgi:hypothetical protein
MTALVAIEKSVLVGRAGAIVFYLALAGAALALWLGNRRFYRTAALCYDEQPEAALIELGGGD